MQMEAAQERLKLVFVSLNSKVAVEPLHLKNSASLLQNRNSFSLLQMASSLSKSPSNNSNSSTSTSTTSTSNSCGPHKPLTVLSGHSGPISSLTLCGDFLLSASTSNDIILWQYPFISPSATFPSSNSSAGHVKSLLAFGNRVFSAHQDARIRVWNLSANPENMFKLVTSLPTKSDCLSKILKQSNYVQTRRHHKKLWIQHADAISCLAAYKGLLYSGSWDKTLKVWRVKDFKCLESIRAHDDAINAVVACDGLVYSASGDGKIKVWGRGEGESHCLMECLEGHRDVCWNALVVCKQGEVVYGGGSDGRVMGWEKKKGEKVWRLVCDVKAHDSAVLCLCSMGEFVCSGSADKSIGVWRRKEEEGRLWRVGSIRGHEGPVKCLQASEIGVKNGGGFMLYSGGFDKSLRVWWVPKEYGDDDKEEEEEEGVGMKKCILLR